VLLTLATRLNKDLQVTDEQKETILSAFFLSYALFQIPMGSWPTGLEHGKCSRFRLRDGRS